MPTTATVKDDVLGLSREAFITVAGIVTSAVVAVLSVVVARTTGFDPLSFSLWFIVPVGAGFAGFAAAGGYYFAARWTQTMPSRHMMWNMVAIGASTWILAHWLEYATLTLKDGTNVSDVVGFWRYWQLDTESTSLTFGVNGNFSNGVSTGELGSLGYVQQVIQFAGFLVGGFVTYTYLNELERCDECRKYALTHPLLNTVKPEVFDAALREASVNLPNVADHAVAALNNRPLAGLSLSENGCPRCFKVWLRPSIVVRTGKDSVATVRLLKYMTSLELVESLRVGCRRAQDTDAAKAPPGFWTRMGNRLGFGKAAPPPVA